MTKPNELCASMQHVLTSQIEKPTLTVLVTNAKGPVVLQEGLSVAASDTKEDLLRLVKCEGRDNKLRRLALMNYLVPLPDLFKLLVRNTQIKPKIVPNFMSQKVSLFCRSHTDSVLLFHTHTHPHAHPGTCLNV